jgi:hypothetical protein
VTSSGISYLGYFKINALNPSSSAVVSSVNTNLGVAENTDLDMIFVGTSIYVTYTESTADRAIAIFDYDTSAFQRRIRFGDQIDRFRIHYFAMGFVGFYYYQVGSEMDEF